ncbi:hypothetical protein [Streptomyces chrestomyceticus]
MTLRADGAATATKMPEYDSGCNPVHTFSGTGTDSALGIDFGKTS